MASGWRGYFFRSVVAIELAEPAGFLRARFRKRWTAFVRMLMAERRAAGKNAGAPARDLFDLMGDARDPEPARPSATTLGDQIATMISGRP
jgi:unspecific monooxygenase